MVLISWKFLQVQWLHGVYIFETYSVFYRFLFPGSQDCQLYDIFLWFCRSNFLGTKFTIYDSQPPHSGAIASTSRASRRIGAKQVSPRVPAGSYNIAHIGYELNVLGTRGPRRMQCIMHSIPASAVHPGGSVPTPIEPSVTSLDQSLASFPSFGSKSCNLDSPSISEPFTSSNLKDEPLILKNKAPRWHEQLQCWCLNFRGRVTVASVKNFQLVAAPEPNPTVSQNDYDRVILQFGKVGKDMFTMDYRYPLSAFQAFAIKNLNSLQLTFLKRNWLFWGTHGMQWTLAKSVNWPQSATNSSKNRTVGCINRNWLQFLSLQFLQGANRMGIV